MDRTLISRILIYAFAGLLIGGSLLYSNYLARELAEKEHRSVEDYADALKLVSTLDPTDPDAGSEAYYFILTRVVQSNGLEIPKILLGENNTIDGIDLRLPEGLTEEEKSQIAREMVEEWSDKYDPVEVEFTEGRTVKVAYGESFLLQQLRWFPLAQVAIALVFIGLVFGGFAISKRNEQNRVWVGLARETAHQLGTPVSSLMAWIELLKMKAEESPEDLELVQEMERDIKRLEMITERFSKIGSKPELIPQDTVETLERSAEYIRKRMSRSGNVKVEVVSDIPEGHSMQVNPQLFDWVIENLLKNALDAIQNQAGSITLYAKEKGTQLMIDVADTGKGIPKSQFKQVFNPGFTTKKRGWGLGLSLTKRIVENYHGGKIFVKQSEVGKGTTFRIILPNPSI
ncbi:HAMP domain-containing sensor histidine kinase [Pontibacter sp. G13]|uniref:sensor histidine kinase n=1 Tax=Pontibacter sp. G13 TaxID=3074898 RepID=UPI0028892C52|nr:HAMP domain-containing sensor histidine kinase [Pontibacter sp. G13]WNJ20888.1 HAMP domain-containing sensor histidine kinase [Pontibacter sp. G13]